MKNKSALDARIRSVRQRVRSGQPLDYRIRLVRERYMARKKSSVRTIKVRLDK